MKHQAMFEAEGHGQWFDIGYDLILLQNARLERFGGS